MSPMRVLALDFDGVISDSAPEAFVVALRTFCVLHPVSGVAADAAALDGPGAPDLADVRKARLYAPFLEMMPLGNRAEDYGVVLLALEQGREVPSQRAYDALRQGCSPSWLARFHQRFYEVRDAISESDPEGWHRLMAPYPALLDLLRRRAGDTLLAIATAKDRRTVAALLSLYGIEDLFDADRLLDKETGVSKSKHLAALKRRFGVGWEEITFVDDKVNHLEAVASLGVRCALAAWGYNGERERRRAQERGYLVCELGDVERQLFG